MTLVAACVKNVYYLQTEEKFCDICDEVVTQIDAHLRRTRRDNTFFQIYKASLDAFRPFGFISRACQGPRDSPQLH